MSEGAPMCRWLLGDLLVDIMPTEGSQLGLNTQWFEEALQDSKEITYAGTTLRVASPVGLLVTKYLTFTERGKGDYYCHDLEDFIAVIDGRDNIVEEVSQSRAEFRSYLADGIGKLMIDPDFNDALPGHLPPDAASQQRLPGLREKLRGIAALG